MDVPGFALITGAGSGIGKACALTFARDGVAGIALLDINQDALMISKIEVEEQQKRLERPCHIEVFTINIAIEEDVNQAISEAAEQFGRLDYVVNAAGITVRHEKGAAFASIDDWRRVIDINLTGSFLVLRAAARIMLTQTPILSRIDGRALQRGSIVNFGSILSLVGKEMSTGYVASKHGVLGLSRTASEDYAKDGLRINTICPGFTATPMALGTKLGQEATQHAVDHKVPMMRLGTPQEMADGAVWLAGGRSSFVTGIALCIDGGYTQR